MADTPAAPRKGMMVKKPRSFRGENRHHYYTQLIEVLATVEDKDYGAGIAGYSAVTGRPVIVFSNPVLSEQRKASRNVKTMTDWVNGLRISGRTYTFGPGAWVIARDITTRADVPPRRITLEGREVLADVLFCQWISSWRTVEQADSEDESKEIFWGYVIARVYGGGNDQPENVVLHVFEPVGPGNRLNGRDEDYPVIFRARSIKELEGFLDGEQKKFPGCHSSYMVRVIDRESGKIVGAGDIISSHDYRNPNDPPSTVFLRNMARRLSLTTNGIDQLLREPDYAFELYGLMDLTPNRFNNGDDTTLSLAEQILNNERLVRRDAPRADGGSQNELVAVPCALRGRPDTERGAFWLDKVQIIGYVGMNDDGTYSAESDIIPADSYSGTEPDRRNGHILERGLDRISPEFGEGDKKMAVDTLRDLTRALGCEAILYPDGRWNPEVFAKSWDRRNDSQAPRESAGRPRRGYEDAPREEPAPRPRRGHDDAPREEPRAQEPAQRPRRGYDDAPKEEPAPRPRRGYEDAPREEPKAQEPAPRPRRGYEDAPREEPAPRPRRGYDDEPRRPAAGSESSYEEPLEDFGDTDDVPF